MKINFVEVSIKDLRMDEQQIKLPQQRENLEVLLIRKKITEKEQSSYKYFDAKPKSVVDTEIENFNIIDTVNIFYLNMYFQILKKKNIDLPEKDINLSTGKLKKMIGKLLQTDTENLNLYEIEDVVNSKSKKKNTQNKKDDTDKQQSENKAFWVENGEFRFSVKEMMKNARNKKKKN